MNETTDDTLAGSGASTPRGSRRRRLLAAGGLLAAGTLTGGVLAGTVSASAATTAPSATASASGQSPGAAGAGGSTPVRSDEKTLSAADAAKVKAVALTAVPGGTVYRVETDAGDGTYEAHMTKADGTLVTVKLNRSFALIKVEAGMGQGDPALKGQPAAGTGAGPAPGGPSA